MNLIRSVYGKLAEGIHASLSLCTKFTCAIGVSVERLILIIADDALVHQTMVIAAAATKTVRLPGGLSGANVWGQIHIESDSKIKVSMTNATSGNTGSLLIEGSATYNGFGVWHIEPYTTAITINNPGASSALVRVTVTKLPSLVTNDSFKNGQFATGVETPD